MSNDEPCCPTPISQTVDEQLLESMNYRDAEGNCADCKFSTIVGGGPEHACNLNPAETLDVLATKVCDHWEARA